MKFLRVGKTVLNLDSVRKFWVKRSAIWVEYKDGEQEMLERAKSDSLALMSLQRLESNLEKEA